MTDPITRLNAALEGRYRIERELGQGGMATVYLADDIKHERKVALKVLKPELAAVVGAERFLAEIKTTANLQHPHILPLFDSGAADTFLFYVMPYVEGETLREKLDREHQLPVDEAVRLTTAVASALDYAHRHGVIHRDIKPGNILIHDGQPVISDFGIALAVGTAGQGRLTETGLSVGTPHYMSPEQATGDLSVGAATDVYALGCVLYEMLVGEPPYTGSTAQAILGKIIAGKLASATEHRRSVPPHVDAAIRKALEKLPADRCMGAQELAKALGDTGFRHGEMAVAGTLGGRAAWGPLQVAVACVAVVSTLGLGWSLASGGSGAAEPMPQRLSMLLPADRPMAFGCLPCRSVAISPDGRDVVYTGVPADAGATDYRLVVRSLGSPEVRDLPGTTGAAQPFFSPDGQWVGFFTADGELKKVPLTGGTAVTLADGVDGAQWGFGAWTDDDVIVFSVTGGDLGLSRISADGGSPQTIAAADTAQGESLFLTPVFVPEGGAVLFTVASAPSMDVRIESLVVETGARRVVLENARGGEYLTSGHLLFQRNEVSMVAPFDAGRLEITGPAVPLTDPVRGDGSDGSGRVPQWAVSRNGTLAYVPAAAVTARTLGLVSREGVFEAIGPGLSGTPVPRISPDGRFVAFQTWDGDESRVMVYDVARGSTNRLTQSGREWGPVWRPNGRELAIGSTAGNREGMFLADLSGARTLLVTGEDQARRRNASWSPDGETLAYTVQNGGLHDIWVLPMGEGASARPFLDGPASEYSPAFSPDGRWLAYVSDESGRYEAYVRGYPQGDRLSVSTDGGQGPVWGPDGSELFFQGPDPEGAYSLMVVSVEPEGGTLRLGAPTKLFDMRVTSPSGTPELYGASNNLGAGYDIFPDGQRFVMSRGQDPRGQREIVLVQNFFEEVRRLAPN